MASIEITVDEDNLTPTMTRLEGALSNDSIGFWLDATVDPYLQRRVAQAFATEGSAAGKWAPLADETVQRRTALGFGGEHPILIQTGDLEKYLTDTPGNITEYPGGVELASPGESPDPKIGVRLAVHQKGSRKNRTPRRQVLAIDAVDEGILTSSLTNHIIESMRGDFQ